MISIKLKCMNTSITLTSNYMNTTIVKMIAIAAFLTVCRASSVAQLLTPDLKAVPDGKGWKGAIADAKLVEKDGAPAIEFNTPGSRGGSVIWLDGFEFDSGTIEFDAKGKSTPPQYSFVGVAFRVVGAETHDTVYFRPFNFRVSDPEKRSHAVQYV